MAEAKEFKAGQRVSFFRLHDKATRLFGTVVKDVKGFLHIETEAANGSVSRIEEADPKDVTAVAEEKTAEPAPVAPVEPVAPVAPPATPTSEEDAELIAFVTSHGYSEEAARSMLTGYQRDLIIADLARTKAKAASTPVVRR